MKKTKIVLLLLSILCCISVSGQNSNQYNDMINRSLLENIEMMQSHHEKIFKTQRTDFSTSYLLVDNYPRGFEFSQQVKDFGFRYVSFATQNGMEKISKKPVSVLAYYGPVIKGDSIEIAYSHLEVSRKRNITHIATGGCIITCIWRFSPESQKWELIDTKETGL